MDPIGETTSPSPLNYLINDDPAHVNRRPVTRYPVSTSLDTGRSNVKTFISHNALRRSCHRTHTTENLAALCLYMWKTRLTMQAKIRLTLEKCSPQVCQPKSDHFESGASKTSKSLQELCYI